MRCGVAAGVRTGDAFGVGVGDVRCSVGIIPREKLGDGAGIADGTRRTREGSALADGVGDGVTEVVAASESCHASRVTDRSSRAVRCMRLFPKLRGSARADVLDCCRGEPSPVS